MNSIPFGTGRGRRGLLFVLLVLLVGVLALGARAARPAAATEAGIFALGAPVGAEATAADSTPLGITTLDAADATLAYSTYLGGSSADHGYAIALDNQGNIYITGSTMSENFLGYDTTPYGYSDIYVVKLDPTGKTVKYLSIIGSKDSDQPQSIAVDAQGNAYITAVNHADDWPLLNPLWDEYPHFAYNGALVKLDPNGNGLYSTLIPLNLFDSKDTLHVDTAGNVYIVGTDRDDEKGSEIGLLKINPAGTQVLMQKKYGGPDFDYGAAITVDSAGVIYIAGRTENGDGFPTTPNALQPECGDMALGDMTFCFEDGVVLVLSPSGAVTYSSHLGGSFSDEPAAIGADGKGNIVVTGNTTSGVFPLKNALIDECPIDPNTDDCYSPRGFVTMMRLQGDQASLVYSTYLSSSERHSTNRVLAGAINSVGQATVVGYTNGKLFPTASPTQKELALGFCSTFSSDRLCFDAFVTTFNPNGTLAFSTYLGGNDDEFPYGVALGGNGAVYVAGMTQATDFPTTADALQPNNLLSDDAFLSRIGSGVTPPPPPPPPPGKYNVFVPGVMR